MASISDLYLDRARRAGEAERASGDRRAALWQGAGNAVASTVGQIAQYQQDAPRRKLEGLQVQQAESQMQAGKRDAQEAMALKTAKTPEEIIGIVGPERGAKILSGLEALESARTKRFADKQKVIADTLAGLDATPEPLRAEAYGGVRKTLLDAGVITPQDAPEAYDAKWFASARNFGAPQKAPEGFTLNPGDTRYGPDGKPIATAAATPEKPAPPVYVTVKGPGGKPIRRLVTPEELKNGVEEYREPQAPRAPEPLEAIVGPNGQPVLVPRSQAVGKMPATSREKPTEDERKTAGFYSQMRDAIATIDETEPGITEKELYQIQTLPQEGLVGMINRGELSEAAKRYVRAFEQFTESRLRPVSGAAIADTEYARDRRTYAKQYGETPKLNEDRTRARNLALESLGKRAGVLKPKDGGDDQKKPTAAELIKKYGGG